MTQKVLVEQKSIRNKNSGIVTKIVLCPIKIQLKLNETFLCIYKLSCAIQKSVYINFINYLTLNYIKVYLVLYLKYTL